MRNIRLFSSLLMVSRSFDQLCRFDFDYEHRFSVPGVGRFLIQVSSAVDSVLFELVLLSVSASVVDLPVQEYYQYQLRGS